MFIEITENHIINTDEVKKVDLIEGNRGVWYASIYLKGAISVAIHTADFETRDGLVGWLAERGLGFKILEV